MDNNNNGIKNDNILMLQSLQENPNGDYSMWQQHMEELCSIKFGLLGKDVMKGEEYINMPIIPSINNEEFNEQDAEIIKAERKTKLKQLEEYNTNKVKAKAFILSTMSHQMKQL